MKKKIHVTSLELNRVRDTLIEFKFTSKNTMCAWHQFEEAVELLYV